MTDAPIRIHPAALEEAEAAVDWYRSRSWRAAEMFLDELDRAIDQVAQYPRQHPEYESGTRRMVLRGFPFLLIYRETAAGVQILAVAHGRRRPGYWRDRV